MLDYSIRHKIINLFKPKRKFLEEEGFIRSYCGWINNHSIYISDDRYQESSIEELKNFIINERNLTSASW